ncbi:hypothetical protein E4631_17785 [Hymenobacter sp. UV11]|uniref:hypothetical protein n=1 Tax=Hymenobacter sp. UV11 TaxID=1849735 RepID=UPI00105EF68C|nr:hypothetical protein [Hymenobacter sp. UV11]TDN40161.1 hypothetical protein A8B98_14795 [Hymenobacter sp. UV11]TFZ64842.1 hypothetical protein E4631_17785 [Hymenobacter sp. UV11]
MRTIPLFLVAAGFSLASLPAMAQLASATIKAAEPVAPRPTSVADRAEALTVNMTQALSLNPAQVEKVRLINTNSVRNLEAARVRYRQEPAKLRGSIEDIGLARLEQLKDVLNPAQFARYQQKREEKMGIPTVRGNQGNPTPGLPTGRGDDN